MRCLDDNSYRYSLVYIFTDVIQSDRTTVVVVLCDVHASPAVVQSRHDNILRRSVWSVCRLYEIILLSVWTSTR